MSLQLPRTERMKSYIKEILADGERHSTREITEYVDEKLKQNGDYVFQINSYVNAALRLLMKEGEYNKVAYGQYQKGGIPYTPVKHGNLDAESTLERNDINSVLVGIRAYVRGINEIFTQKPPFPEMDTEEKESYLKIKGSSLKTAKELREKVDELLSIQDSFSDSVRNSAIRKHFIKYLSDGKPHKMNDIKDYVFSQMMENGEYGGERNTAYIYSAIKSLVSEEGPYMKVARGIFQKAGEQVMTLKDTVFSMDDVARTLDRGFNLSEKNVEAIILSSINSKAKYIEDLATDISQNIETCIDNTSVLIAFAEDYMDRRQEENQEQGMTMTGL